MLRMIFLSNWCWELLSFLAGTLLTLAFAPFYCSYLALISLGIVFLSWLDCSPSRAALRGYIFGLGLFGSGIYWVYISIHDYGGATVIGSVLLTVLVFCFWSVFPAITGYISVKFAGKNHQRRLIWFIPCVWILVEYFRGYWVFNGFPWLQISYTQLETPLQSFIPIIGGYGTGFLLAITVSCVIAGFKRYIKRSYAVLFVLLLWITGNYLYSVEWTKPIGESIKVSLIQGNIPQDQKWLPANQIKTLLSYKKMTADNLDSDIIIWPETAIPVYLSQVQESYLYPLSKMAKASNTDLIVGLPARGKNNKYFNTALTLGKNKGRYNKNHLLPFGEYLPLQPISGFILGLLNIHLGNFTSGGDKQELLQAGGHPFAISICYEDVFSADNIKNMPEAAFLVNLTNDAWFGNSLELHQHMQLAQMRALEVGRYMLRATNTGITAIVAPNGSVVTKAPTFKQHVLTGNILPMGGLTPYATIGDGIIIFCLLMLATYLKIIK